MSQTANVSSESGGPKSHGQKGAVPTPAGQTADVQIILNTPTMKRGDFLEACKNAADQFGLK